jgi:hypothetical protein
VLDTPKGGRLDLNHSNPSTLAGFRHRTLATPWGAATPIDFAAPTGHELAMNGLFPTMRSAPYV